MWNTVFRSLRCSSEVGDANALHQSHGSPCPLWVKRRMPSTTNHRYSRCLDMHCGSPFYAMFWPGPDYAYGQGYYDVYGDYAYGGPARTRAARARNVDREITGSTTNHSSDLAQTCGGLAPGVTDLPFDYIEQAIKPTDEQLKALVALKAASSQASDALKASCSSEVLLTPLGRLDTVQKRLDGMIQAVGIVRTPLDNFYNSLSEEQRQRFAALGPASDARANRRGSASGNDLAAFCSRRTESFTQLPVERIEQAVINYVGYPTFISFGQSDSQHI